MYPLSHAEHAAYYPITGGSEEESVPDLFTLILNLALLKHHFKMWHFYLRRIPSLLCASLIAFCVAGTGAAAGTVTGARGHSVSLPAGITVAPDIARIEWSRTSPRTKITTYSAENIEYYTTNYKGRVTLHRGNFSLEIRDLRRDDAGDYQVDVVTSSGSETQARVRLEVYEPVAGTQIKVQNTTGICNLTCSVTSGDLTSFRWWRGQEPLGNDSTHHPRRHGETIEVHHTAEVRDVVYKCEASNLVSEGTAQILLPDVCKQAPPGRRRLTWNKIIIISVVAACVAVCIIFLVCFIVRRRTGGQNALVTGDPSNTETIYAQPQPSQRHPANRQPLEENEMAQNKERLEIPSTIYDTVKSPMTPVPGPAKRGGHRNPRESMIQEYETVNYSGIPHFASIKGRGRAHGKSHPL
ncbi:SLAM family member 5-like isoform X2 [Amblyraja radiata]|uniref:SLAM family member 5-like isoform X2 n=1 Tax=Amblyraja radiata TaxID=386614 RepID=UPI001402157D|nr:SLAM family member 5-like isoform X2 [Amblyraja radiata]